MNDSEEKRKLWIKGTNPDRPPFWRKKVRDKQGAYRSRTLGDNVKGGLAEAGKAAATVAAGAALAGAAFAGSALSKRGARRVRTSRAVSKHGVVRNSKLAKAVDHLPVAKGHEVKPITRKDRLLALSAKLDRHFEFVEGQDPRTRNGMGQFSDTASVTGVSPSTTTAAYDLAKKKKKPKSKVPEVATLPALI